MKKLFFLLAFSLMLISCEKEETQSCNCGVIIEKDFNFNSVTSWYWVEVTNTCTGADKEFELPKSEWNTYNVGNKFCHSQLKQW